MPTPTPTSASTTDDADDALFRRLQLLFKEDPPSAELHDLLHLLGETPAELGFSAPAAQTSPPQAPRDAYSALETLLAPFAPPPPRPAPSLAPIPNRAAPAQRPLSPPQLTPELVRAILCTAPEPKHRAVHDTPPNRPPTQHPTPPAPHMSDVESHPAFAPQPRHSSAPPGDQITHPAFASHFASQLNRTAPPVPAHRRPDAFASDQRPQQHTPGDEYGAQQRPQQHSLGNQYQRPLQHRQPQRRPLPQSQQQPQAPGNRSAQQPGPFRTAHSKLLQDRRRAGKRGGGGGDGGARPGNGCVRGSGGGDGPTDLVPEGSLRAMGRAVLGPAKRPRFSAPRPNAGAQQSRAPNKDGTTRDDLPEIPNVEPRLVEMIMNEMLDSSPGVDWDDIAGLHFAKRCVMEAIVWPMKRPDIFTGLRGPPKGLLLFGPPGTGKTLIGRAIASKSGAKFFNISASSLMSKWVGEGEKMVRALFAVARVFQPSVVFIDEIDSLLTQRTDSDQESSRRVKTEFLVQMDGAGTSREDRVLVVGATNRPQELDEAARRRLVKRLYIPLPDGEARKSLVKRLLDKQANCCSEQDYEEIVVLSKGYSGSDMYALCAEAALGPVRDLGEAIGSIDADSVRPINKEDFKVASRMVRASVSDKDLDGYVSWNESFGSFPMTDPKAAT